MVRSVRHRRVEQLAARRAHNPEAGGSSPLPAIFRSFIGVPCGRGFFLTFKGQLFSVPGLRVRVFVFFTGRVRDGRRFCCTGRGGCART